MAMAVAFLQERKVKRIILARPAVEAGEKLGFLPGDLAEKVNPYPRPLYDALNDMMAAERAASLIEQGVVEVAPLAFMRGRTLNDAFVILDEAQNTTVEQMKMFLTRIGYNSKAVITGGRDPGGPAHRQGLRSAPRPAHPQGHRGHRLQRVLGRGRRAPPAGAGGHQGLRARGPRPRAGRGAAAAAAVASGVTPAPTPAAPRRPERRTAGGPPTLSRRGPLA